MREKMGGLVIFVVAMATVVGALRSSRAPGPSIGFFDSNFPAYQAPQQYASIREHQPFAQQTYRQHSRRLQSPFRDQIPFRDQSLFRDYPLGKDQSPFRNQYYHREIPTFKDDTSHYRNELSLEQQPFKGDTTLEDQLRLKEQSSETDQQSFQQRQQFAQEGTGHYSDSMHSYKEELSDKPIDSYSRQEQSRQPLSFGGHSSYLKYGNHGLGFASVPTLSYGSLPLEGESAMAKLADSTATHKPIVNDSPSPTTATVIDASKPMTGSTEIESTLTTTTMMPNVETNTHGYSQSDTKGVTVPMVSAIPINQKQSLSFKPSSTAMTTSSTISFVLNHAPRSSFNQNVHFPKDEFVGTTPSTFYVQNDVKSSTQDAIVNYLLPEEQRQKQQNHEHQQQHSITFQQHPESIEYVPLAITGSQNMNVQSIPIAAFSAISHPPQTINYIQTTVPRIAFVPADSSASPSLTLGAAIPTGLTANVPTGISTGMHTMLPAHLPEGITAGMPNGIPTSITTSIPTLNFGPSFQHTDQSRQFNDGRRNSAFSPGLQLHLGGFGGLNYVMPSNDLAPRSVELNLPDIPRQHVPMFAKIGFGQRLW
ncbi:uncharacterized protein [Prorops nasuta]|uniref:uncharacterized protein n=1 Tax=Prorops nasuta TaxID=863751 RepID=UPI0034CD42CC